MRLAKSTVGLLFEAYRRNDMADAIERDEPLTQRWLGLGTEAAYRPVIKAGLMRFLNREAPPPRCMGWLCLTDAGVMALEELAPEFQAHLDNLRKGPYADSYRAHYQLAGGLVRSN